MDNKAADIAPIVFWLYGPWETHATKSDLFLCELDSDFLRIAGPEPLEIPVRDIIDYEPAQHGDGKGAIFYVNVHTKGRVEPIKLYPADPHTPGCKNLLPRAEARALLEAIDYYKGRSRSAPDPNPYMRQALFEGKPHLADGKSALKSPLEYQRALRPPLWKVLIGFLIVLVFGAALITAIIFFFGS